MELLLILAIIGMIGLWKEELEKTFSPPQAPSPPPQQVSQNFPPPTGQQAFFSLQPNPSNDSNGSSERNINIEIDIPDECTRLATSLAKREDDRGVDRRVAVDLSQAKPGDYVGNQTGEWREIAMDDHHAHHGLSWYVRQTLVDPAGYLVARTISLPHDMSREQVVTAWNARHGHKPLGGLRG